MNFKARHPGARLLFAGIAITLLLAGTALAADAPTFKPGCGAPGDPVLIAGADFGEDPVVEFDGVEAEVLRAGKDRILVLVPEDTDLGVVDVTVDGDLADGDFTVVEAGSPVVYRQSAEKVTPGTSIVLFGRRLGGGEARFVDSSGSVAATVEPRGGRMVIVVKTPGDLDAGDYTLEIENKDGLDTGDCSPEITVVDAGDAEITAIDPEAALPGDAVTIQGTDLTPRGPCKVVWTDASGDDLTSIGYSNGYDEIRTWVPFKAAAGEDYEVAVKLRAGDETNSLDYTLGTPGAPEIIKVDPDTAPAGGVFRIYGEDLFVVGSRPVVTLTRGSTGIELKVLGGVPGLPKNADKSKFPDALKNRTDELLVQIPKDAADGDYDLTVTVGDETSDAVDFTVGLRDLAVDSMWPDFQSGRFAKPIVIKGAGFGYRGVADITVTFDDGSGGDPLEGRVLVHLDDILVVQPPGGFKDPLDKGTWDVTVIREAGGNEDSADAGEYTVR